MRLSSIVFIAAALTGAPASAQFAAPFGGPGMLSAPEAASGAMGAGAAHSLSTPRPCAQAPIGRDGPRGACLPTPEPRR